MVANTRLISGTTISTIFRRLSTAFPGFSSIWKSDMDTTSRNRV